MLTNHRWFSPQKEAFIALGVLNRAYQPSSSVVNESVFEFFVVICVYSWLFF